MVKYESLAEDPLHEMMSLFEWAGVQFTGDVFDKIIELTSGDEIEDDDNKDKNKNRKKNKKKELMNRNKPKKAGYYKVWRGPDFRYDAWKDEMDPEVGSM